MRDPDAALSLHAPRRTPLVVGLLGLVASLLVRYAVSGYASQDFTEYTQRWYWILRQEGFPAFSRGFSDYTPPYLYCLYAIATLVPSLGDLAATKAPGSLADFVCAWLACRVTSGFYPDTRWLGIGAFFAVLLAPTVVLNSAAWGQSDSIYTAALLGTVHLLLRNQPARAVLAFGVAFAVKLQSVFLLPFLGALVLSGRIKLSDLLWSPVPYVVAILPVWLAGRPLSELVLVYAGQVGHDTALQIDAPNLYAWIPDTWTPLAFPIGVAAAGLLALGFAWRARRVDLTDRRLVLVAFGSLILMPSVLPNMHERYFFAADVFAIVLAFAYPRLLWVPVVVGGTSLLAYWRYLFGYALVPLELLPIGLLIVLAVVGHHMAHSTSQPPAIAGNRRPARSS
jgi:Gpi18-like mannosyltransferase